MNTILVYSGLGMMFYFIGEIFSKYYANSSNKFYFILALLSDLIVYCLWLFALQQKNSISILGTAWTVGFAIVSLCVGLIVFKESINNYNTVGIGLAMLSLYFLCKE